MPRSRLPRLSSITDGSFEPSRRNPILLRNDEGLDTELKPLELGGKTTTLELSEGSAKFSGDLFIDKIRGGLVQSGGDFATSGSINITTGRKLHFQSELNDAFSAFTTGNTYIYADENDIMYFYVGGEKLLTIGQAFGLGAQDKITTFTSSLSIDEGEKFYFEGMDSDSYLHRTTGDVFEFYGDNVKLLGIADSGKIILLNDEYIQNDTDGQVDLVSSGDNVILSSSEAGIWVGYGKRLYFDELSGSEYIYGYSSGGADILELFAGGEKMLQIVEGAANYMTLQPTHRIYFDSAIHTYIGETSADVFKICVGGNIMIQLDAKGDDGNEVSFGSSCVGFTQLEPTYDITTTAVDFRHSNKQFVTFGAGNITNLSSTFPLVSGNFTLLLKQDGTGSRTITNWKVFEFDESSADGSAGVVWAGGSAPTLTTDANHVDIISFYWDADNEIAYGVATLDFQF